MQLITRFVGISAVGYNPFVIYSKIEPRILDDIHH